MKKDIGAKTLLFPAPVLIVATYGADGRPNAMAAAWGGICNSRPPCVTVSLRKATYTYEALMERRAYTINIPGKEYAAEADYFGIASGRDEDKFALTGLTPVTSTIVDAPYIVEFPLNLECKIVHIADLGLHTQFVGEVLNIKVDEELLGGAQAAAVDGGRRPGEGGERRSGENTEKQPVDSGVRRSGDANVSMIERLMPLIYATDTRDYYTIGEKVGPAFNIGRKLMKGGAGR